MYCTRLSFRIALCAFIFGSGLDLRLASAKPTSDAAGTGSLRQYHARSVKTREEAGRHQSAANTASRYFIEFRSRYALSYGHTFAMYGQLNGRGGIATREVAGLHPAGDDPTPWMIGHFLPVPLETGASDGDLEEKYVSARYRITLSEPEYRKVVAYIKHLQATSPTWHAVAYNCNAFVADIARFMGLQTPSSTLLYPADFINELRELNSGSHQISTSFHSAPSNRPSKAAWTGSDPASMLPRRHNTALPLIFADMTHWTSAASVGHMECIEQYRNITWRNGRDRAI